MHLVPALGKMRRPTVESLRNCKVKIKVCTQCQTIAAETVQNNNRHWRRPTQVLKHLRVALKHKHKNIKTRIQNVQVTCI